MAPASLEQRHISELHRLAAELGVERYRLLDRERLAAAIRERGGDGEPPETPEEVEPSEAREEVEPPEAPEEGEPERPAEPPMEAERPETAEPPPAERPEPTEPREPVTGVLDLNPRGHGFIRLEGRERGEDDVYISASQVRRCELEQGDEVSGPVRKPRRGERHRALVHVDTVNGAPPGAERARFEVLTATPPSRKIEITAAASGGPEGDLLLRAADLLCPFAFGQRILVRAAPRSGRTTLLRALARALAAQDDVETIVLLIDERPEEAASWRETAAGAELAIATADMQGDEQARVAELAVARAKRRAEAGADVVLIIDSLSRLAVAVDDPGRAKPIFGAGRETAEPEAGSLTVVATTLEDGDPDGVFPILETTESSLIALNRELAAVGIHPALDVGRCRIAGEESLRDDAELAGARALRSELSALDPQKAAERLRELLESSSDNSALLANLAR